jgi:radical SAM family RiPP maturation amino acid epimerase
MTAVPRHHELSVESLPKLDEYHEALRRNAGHKRLSERWVGDSNFRRAMFDDPVEAVTKYGLEISADDARALTSDVPETIAPTSRAMTEILQEKAGWVHAFYWKKAIPADPRIVVWRKRQLARQFLDLGPFPVRSNVHASLSVELSKGCSVGCWFCALAPERLSETFRHDEAGTALWRGVLRVFRDVLGPGAMSGFLYWGTDPLDNPDYEQFCLDFYEEIGVFPPTTTTLALKDPARTRRLLDLSREHDCWLNRFSILTVKMLDRVHAEFSAEELADVECLPLTREGSYAFGNSGRFRERALKDPELLESQRDNLKTAPWYTGDPVYADSDDYPFGSIGCVTGFLINMVDRRVQLISPCTADDERPLGSIVFAEGSFEGAEDLAALLENMISEHMSPTVRPDARPVFHDWLRYEELEDGVRLSGRFRQKAEWRDAELGSLWRSLGARVKNGRETAGEIVGGVAAEHSVPPEAAQMCLDMFLRGGVLDECRA